MSGRDIDESSENVLSDGRIERCGARRCRCRRRGRGGRRSAGLGDLQRGAPIDAETRTRKHLRSRSPRAQPEPVPESEPFEPEPLEPGGAPIDVELSHEHAAGDLHIPDGYAVLEGEAEGGRRAVGVVVSRFNGKVTTQLLDRALEELAAAECGRRPSRSWSCPVRSSSRGDGTRKDAPVCLHRRSRLHHPRRHASLRLRRERGGERPPARRARDGCSGLVRRAHARPRRAGGASYREGRRGGPQRARDGRSLLPAPGGGRARR